MEHKRARLVVVGVGAYPVIVRPRWQCGLARVVEDACPVFCPRRDGRVRLKRPVGRPQVHRLIEGVDLRIALGVGRLPPGRTRRLTSDLEAVDEPGNVGRRPLDGEDVEAPPHISALHGLGDLWCREELLSQHALLRCARDEVCLDRREGVRPAPVDLEVDLRPVLASDLVALILVEEERGQRAVVVDVGVHPRLEPAVKEELVRGHLAGRIVPSALASAGALTPRQCAVAGRQQWGRGRRAVRGLGVLRGLFFFFFCCCWRLLCLCLIGQYNIVILDDLIDVFNVAGDRVDLLGVDFGAVLFLLLLLLLLVISHTPMGLLFAGCTARGLEVDFCLWVLQKRLKQLLLARHRGHWSTQLTLTPTCCGPAEVVCSLCEPPQGEECDHSDGLHRCHLPPKRKMPCPSPFVCASTCLVASCRSRRRAD
mmetsp:Transcript_36974/g.92727  ORF Transcript_36974/g.92727 Transcript_36974/m.92727 type:complete len:425 (-) Transcript_36974:62-1336(-)